MLVAKRATEIVNKIAMDPDWRQIFNSEEDSATSTELRHIISQLRTMPKSGEEYQFLRSLLGAVQTLMDNLKSFKHEDEHGSSLVIVIDEASSLLKEGNPAGLYVALNRIISCLRDFPIWFFFISTQSKIEILFPTDNIDRTRKSGTIPSTRYLGDKVLSRFPPFLALALDLQDKKRMNDLKSRTEELRKSIKDFAKMEHMALFGRPLWAIYSPGAMNQIAKVKLKGGKDTKYDYEDEHHVFAALSFRLALDVCLDNPKTLPLIRTAVDSYMRVVISMNPESGALATVAPSEPILAKAAMETLCDGQNWKQSLDTFTTKLFGKGLIAKGLKGELYSRLLLVLAQDWARCCSERINSVPSSSPQLKSSITVGEFLKALYAQQHHASINQIDDTILQAKINFTHFVPTDENICPEVFPFLCHELLRRSAALQLAPNQPTYDHLIAYYRGKDDEEFDESKCGVIAVQTKYQEEASTPDGIFHENFAKINANGVHSAPNETFKVSIRHGPNFEKIFVFNEMKNPILYLLFDLGITLTNKSKVRPVQVSYSSHDTPHIWAVHSRGYGNEIFGCLDRMDCTNPAKAFFLEFNPISSDHDKMAMSNRTFHKIRSKFRYAGIDGTPSTGAGTDVVMQTVVSGPSEQSVSRQSRGKGRKSHKI